MQEKEFFLDSVDFFRLLLINGALTHICVFKSGLVVFIGKDAFKGRPVTRGNLLVGNRIVYIFNTVSAKEQPPISLGLCRILLNDFFIKLFGSVKLILHAQHICTVKQILQLFIIRLRHSLLCAAIFTFGNGASVCYVKISATHFAFE